MFSENKQSVSTDRNINAVLAINSVSCFLTEQLHFETVHTLIRDNYRLRDKFYYFQIHLYNAGRY